jgi:hypothetical protein
MHSRQQDNFPEVHFSQDKTVIFWVIPFIRLDHQSLCSQTKCRIVMQRHCFIPWLDPTFLTNPAIPEKNRLKYLQAKYKYLDKHNWFNRLALFTDTSDVTLLESLDRDWVRAGIQAERKCM